MLCGQQVPFSETWPTSGSMRNGRLYPPPRGGHPTGASAFSSSPGLLPTPAAGNFNDGESLESREARRQANLAKGINGNGQGTPLAVALALLKTPTAQLAVNGGSQHPDKRKAGGHGPTLADQVEHLLPTPNATDGQGGNRTVPEARTHRGQDHGPRLRDVAPALLPTPSVADGTGGHKTRSGNRKGEPLPGGIAMLLPTPTSNVSGRTGEQHMAMRQAIGRTTPSQLEAAAQLLSTGDLTDPPSSAGSAS